MNETNKREQESSQKIIEEMATATLADVPMHRNDAELLQSYAERLKAALSWEKGGRERIAAFFRKGTVNDRPLDEVIRIGWDSIAGMQGTTRAVWERILTFAEGKAWRHGDEFANAQDAVSGFYDAHRKDIRLLKYAYKDVLDWLFEPVHGRNGSVDHGDEGDRKGKVNG